MISIAEIEIAVIHNRDMSFTIFELNVAVLAAIVGYIAPIVRFLLRTFLPQAEKNACERS